MLGMNSWEKSKSELKEFVGIAVLVFLRAIKYSVALGLIVFPIVIFLDTRNFLLTKDITVELVIFCLYFILTLLLHTFSFEKEKLTKGLLNNLILFVLISFLTATIPLVVMDLI